MLEFGAAEKWPARLCERKWDELRQAMPTARPEDTANLQLIGTANSAPAAMDQLRRSSHDLTPMPFTNGWAFSRTISAPILADQQKLQDYVKPDDR